MGKTNKDEEMKKYSQAVPITQADKERYEQNEQAKAIQKAATSPTMYNAYTISNDPEVRQSYDAMMAAGSQTADYSNVNAIAEKLRNQPAFSYNVESDPIYQALRKQAMYNGQRAMEDTIGKASALTGGYANSYATSAGSQAYADYLQKLNEQIPTLEQNAWQRYQEQRSMDIQNLDIEKTLAEIEQSKYDAEYGRKQDAFNTLYGMMSQDQNAINTARKYNTDIANLPYEKYINSLYSGTSGNGTSNGTGNGTTSNAPQRYGNLSSTELKSLDSTIQAYVDKANISAIETELGTAIQSGYGYENAAEKYMQSLNDLVANRKMSNEQALDHLEKWLEDNIAPISEKEAIRLWNEYESAIKNEVVKYRDWAAMEKAYQLAYSSGAYKKDFNAFSNELERGIITVTKDGRIIR